MKTILHISHHIGCLRDQEYILTKLGFKVTSLKFQDNVFRITQDIANNYWRQHKDYLNSFDYVLTSDTAPLSRIFLENQDDFKSKLLIWICNRFDYNMEGEDRFYDLFSKAEQNPNIKIIPSTYFEKLWCEKKGIFINQEHITPLGHYRENDLISRLDNDYFAKMYGNKKNLPFADVLVPIYHNDNVFFNMRGFLTSKGVSVYNGQFRSIEQLKQFKFYVHLPDAFCKWQSFELIHLNVPAILPSKDFLYYLSKQPNYFFNVWGSGGADCLEKDWIDWCEWYKPELCDCRFYYHSFNDIPEIIKTVNRNNLVEKFKNASNYLETNILNKWQSVYNSL